jgi:hypothetical protein
MCTHIVFGVEVVQGRPYIVDDEPDRNVYKSEMDQLILKYGRVLKPDGKGVIPRYDMVPKLVSQTWVTGLDDSFSGVQFAYVLVPTRRIYLVSDQQSQAQRGRPVSDRRTQDRDRTPHAPSSDPINSRQPAPSTKNPGYIHGPHNIPPRADQA